MVQQGKEDSPKKVSEPGAASSKSKACETPPLPSREEVRLFTQGRAPFHCLSCDKRLSKSSLRSHLKNKHPGVVSSLAFTCLICSESLSSLGAINTHSHAELYPCFKCEAKKSKDPPAFPDFERLKSHLFNAHNRTLWPWTCSVCEAVSFFELDHILHARCHSPKEANNLTCPANTCLVSAASLSDLHEHLLASHLPQKMANDENAVNHEIATLLLNLASRTTPPSSSSSSNPAGPAPSGSSPLQQPEDLSKGPQMQAMDLSSKKSPLKLPIDAAKLKNMTITPVSTTSNGGLEPNVNNGVSSSTSNGGPLTSNYLLQNLLLGKMAQQHQLIVPSSSSSASAIMVQGSPKYALKSSSQHPAGVISIPNSGALMNHSNHNLSSNNNNNNNNGSIPLLCGQIVAQLNGLLFLVHDLNSPALENSLQASLGSIYGRLQEIVSLVENTKSKVDGSSQDLLKHNEIQKQIKESKQKEEEKIAKHIQEYQRALLQQQQHHAVAAASSTFISKVPSSPLPPSQVLPTLKETLPVAAANSVVTMLKKQGLEATIKFDSNGTNYVNGAELLHHHTSLPDVTGVSSSPASSSSSSEHMEVESSTGNGGRRRRGRPPKNSSSNGLEGPLEKKFRESPSGLSLKSTAPTSNGSNGNAHPRIPLAPSPVTSPPVPGGGGAKGSKGIRNRVFCGECPGCLKNDDCGRCRYCQDKTKFGGQNRLRQKCLHRRCQMDTHRKRASSHAAANSSNNNNTSNGKSLSPVLPIVTLSMEDSPSKLLSLPGADTAPATIYSGVDLAKIQENIVINKKPHMEDRVTITNSKTKEEVEIKALLEDAKTLKDPEDPDEQQPSKEMLENGVSSSSCSKDDSDDAESSRSGCPNGSLSSRIDKWKMKHEAMLKKGKEESKRPEEDGEEKAPEENGGSSESPLCIDFEPESLPPPGGPNNTPSNPTVNKTVLSV